MNIWMVEMGPSIGIEVVGPEEMPLSMRSEEALGRRVSTEAMQLTI